MLQSRLLETLNTCFMKYSAPIRAHAILKPGKADQCHKTDYRPSKLAQIKKALAVNKCPGGLLVNPLVD